MQDRAWGAARWALRGGLLAGDDGVQLVVVPVELLEFQVWDSGGWNCNTFVNPEIN
jgi:hypothetical protein